MAIKYILVQSGYAVFGAGETRAECLRDACESLEADEQGKYTPERIEDELLSPSHSHYRADGGWRVLTPADAEFDSYLESQGGFSKTADGWIAD